MSDFNSMQLHPSILKAVKEQGYETPTPIQALAIPHLLRGKDLLGIAQTGTGKTAAFSLPIINRLAKKEIQLKNNRTRVLILTPTRELASQIDANIQTYSKGLRMKSKVIFGGVGHRPQIQAMSRGVDILVATPGRLLDLMSDGYVKFDQLEVFVLDEADRMLDMGFVKDVEKIIAKLPKEKQTLLFSATMPRDIARLANSLLKNPEKVEVTPQATTVEKIDQQLNYLENGDKPLRLKSILEDDEIKSVLVFTRTKHGANRVVKYLDKEEIRSAAIHGNKSQSARERALGGFREGSLRVLVATDIAARGIDIPQVSHVINFNLPDDAKSYVHRIGRTARAGRSGVAISFCDGSEVKLLKDIEKFINLKLPVNLEHGFHCDPSDLPEKPKPPGGGRGGSSNSKSARSKGGRSGGGRAKSGGGKPNSGGKAKSGQGRRKSGPSRRRSAAPAK